MMLNMRKYRNNDHAISPVIGTILMVAATVIIAGAVYAAVNAYSGKATKTGPDASFKAQSIDTDGDGLEDTIKVTYLSGPSDSDAADVIVKDASDGSNLTASAWETSWSPGDYEAFTPDDAGTYYVTVLMGDTTILDQTLELKE